MSVELLAAGAAALYLLSRGKAGAAAPSGGKLDGAQVPGSNTGADVATGIKIGAPLVVTLGGAVGKLLGIGGGAAGTAGTAGGTSGGAAAGEAGGTITGTSSGSGGASGAVSAVGTVTMAELAPLLGVVAFVVFYVAISAINAAIAAGQAWSKSKKGAVRALNGYALRNMVLYEIEYARRVLGATKAGNGGPYTWTETVLDDPQLDYRDQFILQGAMTNVLPGQRVVISNVRDSSGRPFAAEQWLELQQLLRVLSVQYAQALAGLGRNFWNTTHLGPAMPDYSAGVYFEPGDGSEIGGVGLWNYPMVGGAVNAAGTYSERAGYFAQAVNEAAKYTKSADTIAPWTQMLKAQSSAALVHAARVTMDDAFGLEESLRAFGFGNSLPGVTVKGGALRFASPEWGPTSYAVEPVSGKSWLD